MRITVFSPKLAKAILAQQVYTSPITPYKVEYGITKDIDGKHRLGYRLLCGGTIEKLISIYDLADLVKKHGIVIDSLPTLENEVVLVRTREEVSISFVDEVANFDEYVTPMW